MAVQTQLDIDIQREREQMEALLHKGHNKTGMKIKKNGHCCLVIETRGIRIMTDPGMFTTAQEKEKDIAVILITHEHADHFHIESLKNVLANNPEARVITNSAVGALLKAEHIAYQTLEHGGKITLFDIVFEGHGDHHAEIYKDFRMVQNTGFFIDNTLFYPGDAFVDPEKPVPILALPVSAPWLKVSEVIDYALALKPTKAFPVYDAILAFPTMMEGILIPFFAKEGIEFVQLNAGDEREF